MHSYPLFVQGSDLYTADWGQPDKMKKLKVALHVGYDGSSYRGADAVPARQSYLYSCYGTTALAARHNIASGILVRHCSKLLFSREKYGTDYLGTSASSTVPTCVFACDV